MKKLVVTLAVTLACIGAFAQGKVAFQNNTLHLVYVDPGSVLPAGVTAGQAVGLGGLLGGKTLVADLYAGTSASSLSRVSTTGFAATGNAGLLSSVNLTLTGIPVGTAYFQVVVRDNQFATGAESAAGGSWFGQTPVFTTVTSGTIAFNSIVNTGTPAFSTWLNGTFDVTGSIAGGKGGLAVSIVPEPGSMALAGLGAAALLIFRRRK